MGQTLRQGGIPFEITTQVDPFYSEQNLSILRESINDMNAARNIVHKTIEELEAYENE
ncbi:MAG: hypothetical protein LBQ95_05190 [Lachnospiraceae bacterium]|nr:hypothetical protein [Lachnospiraceae bacterium]